MRPSLTIAVPTIGRPSLRDTLESIARQDLQPHDQVLIVYDSFACNPTHARATRDLVDGYGFTFLEHNGFVHFFGNPQLNRAIALATGDYFTALGDDDVYVDGAIGRMRKALVPGRALLFQFLSPPYLAVNDPRRVRLWSDRQLRVANISGCCLAAPRDALVPVSGDLRIEVDYEWIVDIVAKTGQKPKWLQDCLIIARPDERNGQTVHQGVGECRGCGAIGFLEDFDTDRVCGACAPSVLREFLVGA